MNAPHQKTLLKDTAGASIVIALVFFLICALVGATVLTAATINTKSTVSYKTAREQEYTVSSAANLFSNELQQGVRVSWDWGNTSDGAPAVSVAPADGLAARLWTNNNVDIFNARSNDTSFFIGETEATRITIDGVTGMEDVYATLEVTRDFDIYLRLSLDKDPTALSPYNETVYFQCVATYSNEGKIVAAEWKPAVVTKGNV